MDVNDLIAILVDRRAKWEAFSDVANKFMEIYQNDERPSVVGIAEIASDSAERTAENSQDAMTAWFDDEDNLNRLLAGLEAPLSGWQPIDTAPKDGTWILVANEDEDVDFVEWRRKAWARDGYGLFLNYDPTHWMPLPKAPPDTRQLGRATERQP